MENIQKFMSPLRATNRFHLLANWLRRRRNISIRTLVIIAIISTTTVFTAVYVGHNFFYAEGLHNFKNYSELRFYLHTHQPFYSRQISILCSSNTEYSGGFSYSSTNVQVSGVDELDIVKTNGTFIYTVANDEVVIIRAYPPETAEIVNRISPEGSPLGLFLYDSTRLVVISEVYLLTESNNWEFGISIEVFDVTDPSGAQRINWVTCDGYFIGIRLIRNFIYLIVGSPVRDRLGTIKIPSIGYFGVRVVVPATSIYYNPRTFDRSLQYTMVLTLDVSVPEAFPNVKCYLIGTSYGTVYVSHNNLYLASNQWESRSLTRIHRIQICAGKVVYSASGRVPGRLLNQFSLDEHAGHLRVATTSSESWVRETGIYILNMQLEIVGSIEGLAPNEQIYSARFLGNMGYVVTFLQVDPLFVFNLTEPTNPQLLGELKIPGFSTYLHPLDETHLLGIGRDQGVKLSLFNTTNPFDPQETTHMIIGVQGTTSPALTEHKAVLIDPRIKLLALPFKVTEYKDNSTIFHKTVWQGAYIFYLDHLTATLNVRGQITHLDDLQAFREDPYDFKPQFIQRTGYIESMFYAISEDKITFHNLSDLTLICGLDF